MERFIARQPIFDRHQKIFGYELLFRSGLENYFDSTDPDSASSNIIANSFLLFSLKEMTDNRLAVINASHNTIKKGYLYALPKESVIIDFLQPLTPDMELVEACRKLKQSGYKLALDDFIYEAGLEPLLETIDIVKIDLKNNSLEDCYEFIEILKPLGKRLHALKVEDHQTLKTLLEIGFDYFQGNFFSKPTQHNRKDIPANKLKCMQILKEVYAPEVDFQKLARTIQGEMSVSYKLLKLINSAAFGMTTPVRNVKQALALLGTREIQKWASLITMAEMATDKPDELVICSLARGKACELLAPHVGMKSRADDLFLMGLFSMIDAILDRPMSEALKEIPLESDLKAVLLGEPAPPKKLLNLVKAQEMGLWPSLKVLSKSFGMDENALQDIYIESVQWAHQTFRA